MYTIEYLKAVENQNVYRHIDIRDNGQGVTGLASGYDLQGKRVDLVLDGCDTWSRA